MRARDLARQCRVLGMGDSAVEALRILATAGLPGLVVLDHGSYVVIPASQVLRVALPRYVLDDPSLGRVWDEASADSLGSVLSGLLVSDLVRSLDRHPDRPEPAVPGDATMVQVAATLAAAHVPLVAVSEDGAYLGVIAVNDVVARLIA